MFGFKSLEEQLKEIRSMFAYGDKIKTGFGRLGTVIDSKDVQVGLGDWVVRFLVRWDDDKTTEWMKGGHLQKTTNHKECKCKEYLT